MTPFLNFFCFPSLSFIVPIIAWNIPLIFLIFFKRSLVFLILLFSFISLHLRRLSYPYLLYFGTLHSGGCIFLFLLAFCFSSFFSYLIKPPQETIFPSCTSISWGWFWSLPPIQCYKSKSEFCNKELMVWARVSSVLFLLTI